MRVLLPAVIGIALHAALAALVCAAALYLERMAAAELHMAEGALAAAQVQFREAIAAGEVLRSHSERYRRLRDRGLIGDGQRLAFIESLQRSASALHLREVSWELQPARVVGSVSTSRMRLHLALVHEGELLRLLARLRSEAPAVVWARHCTVERKGDRTTPLRRGAGNLTADCELEWLTVRIG